MKHPGTFLLPIVAIAFASALLATGSSCGSSPARGDLDPRSAEWVCVNEAERVRLLFANLRLDLPGLAGVRAAVERRDWPAACEALVDYYRGGTNGAWLRRAPVPDNGQTVAHAESLLADVFTFYRQSARLPRTREGGIDWNYNGPKDDNEWGWALNNLEHFAVLRAAYFRTGRAAYIECLDEDLRDWVLSNPYPGKHQLGPWRPIEAASRALQWMHTFYELQGVDAFSPAGRILMLSSLIEHAKYLSLYYRRDPGNHGVTEVSGVGFIGAAWPEFVNAGAWRRHAMRAMQKQMDGLVYPDGAETELTSIYQRITTEAFDRFFVTYRRFGFPVPEEYSARVDSMWSLLAYQLRPDGTTPESNDTDRRDIRLKLEAAARERARSDWIYIISNGARGAPPSRGPSLVFPWAGQVIMRSGWDAAAHWSFFDVGPYGIAHQHRDKLHISVDAFGRPLLVDAGRYNYQRGPWRDYFIGSRAHNVVRVDGADQNPGEKLASAPTPEGDYGFYDGWDFTRGVFASGYDGVVGDVRHTRVVVYVHGRFWAVVDRIETDRPRSIEALWHFAPDCSVQLDGAHAVSVDPAPGNIRVAPVGPVAWEPRIVRGAETPEIQGWYSGYYDVREPSPTAIYRGAIPASATFAWVLVPARGPVGPVQAAMLSDDPATTELRVEDSPGAAFLIAVPIHRGTPVVRRGD